MSIARWFLCLFFPVFVFGGSPPEKIYPLSKVIKPVSYYLEQAGNWQAYLETEEKIPGAWMNYFFAAKNANILLQQNRFSLDDIVNHLGENFPESFEYYYLQYLISEASHKDYHQLLKAYEADPDRPETYAPLMTYYDLQDAPQEVNAFAAKLYQSNYIPSGLYEWNYNALMSIEEEAILFTQGENDTYPALILQNHLGIRMDVRVINSVSVS